MTSRPSTLILSLTAIALATTFSPSAFAEDTVITKTGRTYVGEIINKTPSEVTIRFERFKGITETDTISRSDIAEIISESPDLVAFKALGDILPTADLLGESDYKKLIAGAPAGFLKDHPTSQYKPEVEKIVATLESELERVKNGDRKVGGEWYSEEEFKHNKFNIDAQILLGKMREHRASGDTLQALKTFDKIENDYPVSKAYPVAVTEAIEIAGEHKTALSDLLIRLPERLAKRENTSGLEPTAAARAKNAIRMEDAKWAKIRKEEEQAKVKWRSVYAYSKDDIQRAVQATNSEITRLGRIDTATAARVAEAAAVGFAAFEAGDYKQASYQFSAASAAGGKDRLISEMRSRSDKLMKESEKQTEAEREAAELAAELAAKQGATIAPQTPQKKQSSKPKSQPEPAPVRKDKPVAVATEADRAATTDGDGMSLRTILIALLVVVVIAMIVGNIMARKKGVPEEEE